MPQSHIRNFCIIAHIDHGKSTLADRILELTGVIDDRQKKAQFLDRLDLERERGITIKAQAVRLPYCNQAGEKYQFNLIDTPGHVDFHYEVSRSLAACEGALLVVDAAQGVEAQTLANVYLATDLGLEVIPVINKIDLPGAEPDRVRREIEDIIGIDASDALLISAKSGEGVAGVLDAIVERMPSPRGDEAAPARALIFDSWFDSYQGAVVQVRVVDGALHKGDSIRFMETGREYQITALGVYSPFVEQVQSLEAGEVGFCAASIKTIVEARTGETITRVDHPATQSLPGFRESQSMVFAGLYPVDSDDYETLKEALERLQLNDASLEYEPESSKALGFGFRCGFLGLLHLEIVQERLEREFGVQLITTAPTVPYQIYLTDNTVLTVSNPAQWPDVGRISRVEEPRIEAVIHTPNEYVGSLIGLCESKRGQQKDIQYVTAERVLLTYLMPMNEIVMDFYDKLKSMSRGYASMDYHYSGYDPSALVKMDILLNGEPVDALGVITHKEFAYARGRVMIEKLRKVIPRQMYDVALQAAIGNRVIARETIKALRKNVTAKCYGGDISRKRKLLEKQKEGKKRMKQVGRVEVPQEAFMTMLQVGEKKKND